MLYIAGVQHFDPLCRDRLLNWLEALNESHKNPPLFIAVEWDKDIFKKIATQRPILHQLAKKIWPQSSSIFLDRLSEAMAFEGDTHIKLFPNIPTLWLDNGRTANPKQIEIYAEQQLKVYKGFLLNSSDKLNEDSLLIMSSEAWNCANSPTQGNSRDIKFANFISKYCDQLKNCWAIAIVGANHASSVSGYMGSILIDQEIQCDVTILRRSK